MTLRDADIRGSVVERIRAEGGIAVTEFKISNRRADVVGITSTELVVYEIKSDVDTNARLRGQADAYDTVGSRIYLVTTQKKLASMVGIIPPWWGVIVATETPDGVVLTETQDARDNPAFLLLRAYSLLWAPELDGILAEHQLPARTGTVKAVRSKRIVSSLGKDKAKAVWLQALRTRYTTYPELQGSGKPQIL